MSTEHSFTTKDGLVTRQITPLKATRIKCLECGGWSRKAVAKCTVKDCVQYLYRFGHDPSRKGIGGKGNAALLKVNPRKNQLIQQRVLTRTHRNPRKATGRKRLLKK